MKHSRWLALTALLAVMAAAGSGAHSAALNTASASAPTASSGALALRARQLFADANAFWSRQFRALGGSYPSPTLHFFSGTLPKGSCASPEPLAGSFYCPADQQIYLDEALQRQLDAQLAGAGDAALAITIGHEVAHYVQNVLGTTEVVEQARSRSAAPLSRSLWVTEELQADCYAAWWLGIAEQRDLVKLGPDVGKLLESMGAVSNAQQARLGPQVLVTDPILTYGNAAQRLKWFERGLAGHGLAACDTFSAESAGTL